MSREEKFLTPKDVAHILGCNADDVIQLARNGKIRVAAPGRFWRFRPSDVKEYSEQAGLAGSPEK